MCRCINNGSPDPSTGQCVGGVQGQTGEWSYLFDNDIQCDSGYQPNISQCPASCLNDFDSCSLNYITFPACTPAAVNLLEWNQPCTPNDTENQCRTAANSGEIATNDLTCAPRDSDSQTVCQYDGLFEATQSCLSSVECSGSMQCNDEGTCEEGTLDNDNVPRGTECYTTSTCATTDVGEFGGVVDTFCRADGNGRDRCLVASIIGQDGVCYSDSECTSGLSCCGGTCGAFDEDTCADDEPDSVEFRLCQQAPEGSDLRTACENCSGPGKVWTSLGCLDTSSDFSLVESLITFLLGITGGFALVLILYGSFRISVSTGNPEKVKQGRDIIIAAIFGLMFVILSILILSFVGVDLLNIPGFFD